MAVEEQTEQRCGILFPLRSPPTEMHFHGKKLTIAHKSGEICTLDTETKERKVIGRNSTGVTAIAYVKGILLIGTKKGEIKTLINKGLKIISKRHKGQIVSIDTIETDSAEIEVITTSEDCRINLWKLDINEFNGKKVVHLLFIKSLYGPNTPIISSSISPNRKLFACTSELSEAIRIFKLETDTQLIFRLEQTNALFCLFITDEYFAVTSSNSDTIHLFSINNKSPVQTIHLANEYSGVLGSPSSISPISKEIFTVGFSNGYTFIIKFSESSSIKLSVVSSIVINGVPNGTVSDGHTLYIGGGKEERLSRFHIRKSAANGVFAYNILK